MRSSEVVPPWWDRESDTESGQIFRADVRLAAHRIWKFACSRARQILGDVTDAPELLESSVKAVSRYLDRKGVLLFDRQIDGLVFLVFHRSVLRVARRRGRVLPAGGTREIELLFPALDRSADVDHRLLLQQLANNLGVQSRAVLRLRISGYSWKEIGRILSTKPEVARKAFWREVRRAALHATKTH